MHTPEETWEEKFDELLKDYSNMVYFDGDPKRSNMTDSVKLKSFIKDNFLLKEEVRRVIQQRIGATKRTQMFIKSYDDGHDAALTSLLQALHLEDK